MTLQKAGPFSQGDEVGASKGHCCTQPMLQHCIHPAPLWPPGLLCALSHVHSLEP